MTCGVYEIVNTVNGKRYIGSSVKIEKRIYEHFRVLSQGKHHSVVLQRAYDKYGRDVFFTSVVIECAKEDLIKHEQKEIDRKSEYNSSRTAGSPLGTVHTEQTKIKYSERMKEDWRRFKETGTGMCDRNFLDKRAKAISLAKRSRKNYNENQTIYEFSHPDHGTVHMTMKQLYTTFGLPSVSVCHLLKGRQKTCKGWTYKKAPD